MRNLSLSVLLACCFGLTGCSIETELGSYAGQAEQPDTLVEGGYDEAEMDAAIERAISEVDDFIEVLEGGKDSGYAVKVPVEDNGQTEHFWLTDLTFANGQFTGTINNDPGIVTNVAFGDTVKLGKTEISDWMFMRNGKMHGNYTMRPLLATLPEEEAEAYRSM